MKARARFNRWIMVAGLLGLAGCGTTTNQGGNGGGGDVKAQGVYTTVAMPGQHLDLPGSGYTSYRTFSSSQTPAAVVIGYGDYVGDANIPQAFTLRLVESASGNVIETLDDQVYAGRVAVIDLHIRKSGKYQLQLVIHNSVADTWDFTVQRDVSADTEPIGDQSGSYAKGDFSAGMLNYESTDAFNQYDDSLLYALNRAVYREFKQANHDDFVQMPAGHVTIQFDLSATGQVSAPRIIENTLSNVIGQFFLHALQNGAPYKPWPADARAANGADTRTMKVTFSYN